MRVRFARGPRLDSRGSAKVGIAVFVLVTIAIVFAGAGFFFRTMLQPYQPGSAEKTIVEVEKRRTPLSIARELEDRKIVRDSRIFYYYGKLRGSWAHIKAGEYELSPAMTPAQVFDALTSGISVAHPFLVREGMNSYEIADQVAAKGFGTKERFLQIIRDPAFIATLGLNPAPRTLEGYLFPDTYLFPRKTSLEEIARAMVKRFQAAWTPADQAALAKSGLSRQDAITLASMVEKETGAPGERPIIAGVFLNRLRKKMRLQSDPTTIYGIWPRYKGNLHKTDLLESTPYNTYTVAALPAGPISNPGIEAIRAVLSPAQHSWLYFVSKNDGTHTFTSTFEDHAKAVAKFQLDARAREGKSWRDLRKHYASGVTPPAKPKDDSKKAAQRPVPAPTTKRR